MEPRVVAVGLLVVALAGLLTATWMHGPTQVAGGLLVIVAGGGAVQVLRRELPSW